MGNFRSLGLQKGRILKSAFILIAIFLAVYLWVLSEGEGGVRSGTGAPDFSLPSRTSSVSLRDYRGKLLLLNFWATWCPPCIAEMPSLERLKQKTGGQGFDIVAVAVDENWASIRRFLEGSPLTLTLLLDQKGEVAEAYGISHLPVSYLIDREGIVIKKYDGPRTWDSPKIVTEIREYLR
ncbi:MAG: TlpA family protein disulfide reductase [Deltaproteobacteria bacterium]|nr:TlpA family protein disulfide reductase [Deltaproteobacteria bacterium]MBI4374604.1 TlpA family protein disulfide reductase [Deltaproteobacteria bacterium]